MAIDPPSASATVHVPRARLAVGRVEVEEQPGNVVLRVRWVDRRRTLYAWAIVAFGAMALISVGDPAAAIPMLAYMLLGTTVLAMGLNFARPAGMRRSRYPRAQGTIELRWGDPPPGGESPFRSAGAPPTEIRVDGRPWSAGALTDVVVVSFSEWLNTGGRGGTTVHRRAPTLVFEHGAIAVDVFDEARAEDATELAAVLAKLLLGTAGPIRLEEGHELTAGCAALLGGMFVPLAALALGFWLADGGHWAGWPVYLAVCVTCVELMVRSYIRDRNRDGEALARQVRKAKFPDAPLSDLERALLEEADALLHRRWIRRHRAVMRGGCSRSSSWRGDSTSPLATSLS